MNRYTQAWLADLPEGFAPVSDDRLRALIDEARRNGTNCSFDGTLRFANALFATHH